MHTHTFVISAYKESQYLDSCIQSLLCQQVKSNLVIATSTPNEFIAQKAQQYGLSYMLNKSLEAGIANDWNFALEVAQTNLVTIVHQDDIYEDDYALKMVNAFEKSKGNALISFSNYREILDNRLRSNSLNFMVKKILLAPFFFTHSISSVFFKKFILSFGDTICCPSVTFNKAALKDFKFSSDFYCALDWYAWYQLSQSEGAFLFINKKLVQHRIHNESATTANLDTGVRQQEERKILNMIWGITIGNFISRLYSLGHKSNLVN